MLPPRALSHFTAQEVFRSTSFGLAFREVSFSLIGLRHPYPVHQVRLAILYGGFARTETKLRGPPHLTPASNSSSSLALVWSRQSGIVRYC